jgi:hypothetical protein
MQPLGGACPGATCTGWPRNSSRWAAVMCPRLYIRCSTWSRRAVAFSGLVIGSSLAGLCTRPASIVACGSVRSAALTLKYVMAAAWMP